MGSTDDAELGPVGITKLPTTKSAISHPGCGAHYRVRAEATRTAKIGNRSLTLLPRFSGQFREPIVIKP